MEPSRIFELVNFVALIAWALMIFTPHWKYTQKMVTTLVVPFILAVAYILIIAFCSTGSGFDFSSLAEIRNLFNNDYMLLAGWIHYLAFDLLVGCWILKKAFSENWPLYMSIPSLLFTFIMGPVGLFIFMLTYFAKKKAWITIGDR
ncbi:MAG: ABA4-like family protein [Marinoscillum sp.]